jgi:hypothetical protein
VKVYKNSEEVNNAIKNQLNDKEKIDFENGLNFLDPLGDLRNAFKRLLPGKSDKEIDIMVNPEKYK